MSEFIIDSSKYIIGVDLGFFEGDIKSICVVHQESGVITVDENFQTVNKREFKDILQKLEKKYDVVSMTPAGLPRIKQERISHLDNLLINKKIKLTRENLKFFI